MNIFNFYCDFFGDFFDDFLFEFLFEMKLLTGNDVVMTWLRRAGDSVAC